MENRIEKNRPMYLQIGFATSLLLVYMAFQWARPYVMPERIEDDTPTIVETYERFVVEKKEEKPKLEKKKQEKISDKQFKVALLPFLPTPEPDPVDPIEDPTPGVTMLPPEPAIDSVYEYIAVEEYPMFGNGENDLLIYLSKNIKYPRKCIELGYQGTVYVSFVINKAGEVSDVALVRGLGCATDQEAVRVIASMPNWKPGKQRNMPVSVRYTIPVSFRLH